MPEGAMVFSAIFSFAVLLAEAGGLRCGKDGGPEPERLAILSRHGLVSRRGRENVAGVLL
jgi:hypothetical protein